MNEPLKPDEAHKAEKSDGGGKVSNDTKVKIAIEVAQWLRNLPNMINEINKIF